MIDNYYAKKVCELISEYGIDGEIEFSRYERVSQFLSKGWVPSHWDIGQGVEHSRAKLNENFWKLAATVACEMGIVTKTETGYKVVISKFLELK